MSEQKPFTGVRSDIAITYDLSCRQSEMFVVNDVLTKVYQLLKGIGFKVYNPDEYPNPSGFAADFDIEINDPYRMIMIESELSRNMMCIILSQSLDDGSYNFAVHVQDDIGCGWVQIPLRWSEISLEWLTHLKMAIEGHGFNV